MIPRVVIGVSIDSICGRSLVDKNIGYCSINHCNPVFVNKIIANRWSKTGPLSRREKQQLENFYEGEFGNGRKAWWK